MQILFFIFRQGSCCKDRQLLQIRAYKRELQQMDNRFSRTELLFGKEAMKRLAAARVAVFGIGGVGGFTVEALARSGIGSLDLIDSDTVELSNLNRQIIATEKTVGLYKVDVMKERILDINPSAQVRTYRCFYLPETAALFDFSDYDYVVDAVDTVTAKLELVMRAEESHTPVISCMGAGNKLDPSRLRISDIYKTQYDPLSRVMRRELKKRGIRQLKVVFSDEMPVRSAAAAAPADVPGSCSFVPSVAGLMIAGEVIRSLAGAAAAGPGRQSR